MDVVERLAQIEAVVSPVLRGHGLSLVDLQWRREGRRWVLRFYVDKIGGVGIADCQRFSQEVGDLLDASSLIPESYDLEMSSPGLTRELRTEREWHWALGKWIRCWLADALDGRREVVGRLLEVGDSVVRLEVENGAVTELQRRGVTKARLELDFPRRK
ncbi:MAG: ribosome maturation factor RimP [Candidatus Rokubacteria bacterium]|nr:ribosome maturation factor RimP [Candidatus Rokubacteria bacterium]